VCRLKRALYGLKQAPHAWYTRIDSYFTGLGFSKSEADPNLYQIVVEGKLLIIVPYVDDLILRASMLGRYWRSSTCMAASLLILLFLEVGGRRMPLQEKKSMPLFIDSWWGHYCIWSIHDPIYAMQLTSFHKLWLSLPSSSGRRASMYCAT